MNGDEKEWSKGRDCPHGWTDCIHCLYEQLCRLGLYVPDEEAIEQEHRKAVVEAAAAAEKTVHHETLESVKRISQAMSSVDDVTDITRLDSKRFWLRWARTSPPDPQTTQKDVIVPIPGAIESGGSKSGKRRKKLKRRYDFFYWTG